jgi:hypothetical protein
MTTLQTNVPPAPATQPGAGKDHRMTSLLDAVTRHQRPTRPDPHVARNVAARLQRFTIRELLSRTTVDRECALRHMRNARRVRAELAAVPEADRPYG